MNRTRLLIGAGGVLVVAALVWLLFFALPRWAGGPPAEQAADDQPQVPSAAAAPRDEAPAEEAVPRIKARLFYVSEDGRRLVPRQSDVAFGQDPAQQARRIVEAQLGPAPDGRVSAIPEGTRLKELFLSADGKAYVDLSHEISTNHHGGSLDELLTVYTIVNALTENLTAVTEVQILVDGREVDTLAGHVDLRRPLGGSTEYLTTAAGTTVESADSTR